MKQYYKNQCIEICHTLGEIHAGIIKYIEQTDTDRAVALMKNCLEAAVSMGTIIEKSEGEGTDAVKALEDYSDTVYNIYEEFNVLTKVSPDSKEISSFNLHKAEKKLRKALLHVENSIEALPARQEIVFLPYKASMWDSLESVWREADRDENCDAYVIPIPYYDRNFDGSFKTLHYESDQYPKDVPVIDFREYDFEKRRPCKIYIHNPYDDSNLVTSVDPFFYSSNLKKFTDELIYIPYFVLGDIDPENNEQLKGMEHFVTLPGVINADKVIVQSENMRKAYVKILTENYGRRKVWESRISGSGSPKFERVHNLKNEDYELDDEWLSVVTKADGSRKKIILYNTGLTALLEHNEKMLVKIRDVLRVFKENKDDVSLLWRPHPLIEATLTSMRPQLWEDYKNIVDDYKAEKWGIFDDSAELDRAIAVSDAYYGDPSSVVQLYKETGKPIMIENVEVVDV